MIDELAAASRVPSRTIRFYQSRGALMHPEIRGRVAYYGKQHVERLKLIAQLQDRGLRIDAIGDLMKRIDRGEVDLAEWLGVEEQVQAPWALDQARTVTEEMCRNLDRLRQGTDQAMRQASRNAQEVARATSEATGGVSPILRPEDVSPQGKRKENTPSK